ncbi:FAD-dependent oxidoreductase [Nonomuraea phyllanthi]|uniref:FAD-dependent oxidoreductase n=1 Tax=Nonomuraea phyllanthi TaxID=2219224 RepID=A0A5C4VIP6_9ACTN|nr:FAD-dependent monooxygenase [Nonomuraea phyllanthi]KAB8189122.1 FAD-dependent oxidoreductase [Nonomuraea phyllanthi]
MSGADGLMSEVLVVGAGPVGLMAAGELARRGIAVRVVDRETTRDSLSKALVVHARTLEIMDLGGISDEFVKRGYPAPGLDVSLQRRGRPVSVNLRTLDTRFPYMLVLPQRQTEEILAERLSSYGVTVERGSEVVALEQHPDHVVAAVRAKDGREERIRARYLIGCDGAHSTVRRLLDLPFEGKQLDSLVLIGDVKADVDLVRSRITNLTSSRGFVSLLPFLGDHVRVFAVDFSRQNHTRNDALTLEELQETVNAIAPSKITLTEPSWLTRYVAPSRQVRRIRVDRFFLAGDATHAHSPAAGQGMNMGLQDAANLSWKLAMVLRSQAPTRLLDTYDLERHAVHTSVRHGTDQMFRAFTLTNPALQLARGILTRTVVTRAPVQRRLAGRLSGISINYRHAHLGERRRRAALQPGDRVPDADLWIAHRASIRLYELLRDPGYGLFVFATADRLAADRRHIAGLIAGVTQTYGPAVRPHLVVDEGVIDPTEMGAPVYVDVAGHFARKLGARHASVFLLRPDGYLAAHHTGLAPDQAVAALAPWCLQH